MYSNALGWQWQHITVNTIMHLSHLFPLFPSSSSCLDSQLALTLAHCLYLSLYHFLLSPLPARSSSNLLWEWRRHRANANSLFLSESRWVCVWAIDMRTSIKGSSRSTEVVPACVWLRQLYASSKFAVSKARGEGKKKKGQNREGEIRRDQGWR